MKVKTFCIATHIYDNSQHLRREDLKRAESSVSIDSSAYAQSLRTMCHISRKFDRPQFPFSLKRDATQRYNRTIDLNRDRTLHPAPSKQHQIDRQTITDNETIANIEGR